MTESIVSVIVLSFNRCDETLQCLKTVREQTYSSIELVVLDNGSVDGSAGQIEANFPEVTLLRMPTNYGDWQGRNIAFANCTGDYTFIIDSDAVMEPDCIARLIQVLSKDTSIAAIQPMLRDLDSDEIYDAGFGRERSGYSFYKAHFHGCAVMFRTACLRRAGGFPHYLLGGAEVYISLRFHDQGYKILYYPEVEVRHAMSTKERVPTQRLILQSRQKLRAMVAVQPGLGRVSFEILRRIAGYIRAATVRGHLLSLPRGIGSHFLAVLQGLRERNPVTWEASNLYDRLSVEQVCSEDLYDAIDKHQKTTLKQLIGPSR